MHFQIGKGGGFHLYEAEQMQQNLPTNIYLGGPPALILAAIAPLPENIPEILLASLVAGQKLTTTKNPKSLIPIFSECEFCITGQVIAKKRRPEGPFGDHYGYYSLIHDYPVFQAQAVYHRKNAIYPATIVGKPRQEDYYIGEYLQDLLKPLISLAMPGVKDLHSYGETGFHALAGAVLKERYTKESLSTVFRILGEGQLSLTKFLIGIHEDHDLKDFTELLTYILKRVQWENDLSIFADTSMDSLDYTGHKINHGSKGALLVGKEIRRKLPHKLPNSLPESLIQKAGVFCPGCLVLETTTDLKQITHAKMLEDWPLIVAVDDVKKALYSETSFLWTTFTRFDPAQDIIPRAQTIQRNRLVFSGPIAIDARMKPSYPKELFCDQKTSQLVNNRWFEYFPDKDVEMGSSDYAHLR
jgi:3-polyprenyl-4-hydroxybenzoate decarboxylase